MADQRESTQFVRFTDAGDPVHRQTSHERPAVFSRAEPHPVDHRPPPAAGTAA